IAVLDRFDILALHGRARIDNFLAARIEIVELRKIVAKRNSAILCYLLECQFQILPRRSSPFFQKAGEIFEYLFNCLDVSFAAVEDQVVAANIDRYIKE